MQKKKKIVNVRTVQIIRSNNVRNLSSKDVKESFCYTQTRRRVALHLILDYYIYSNSV